MKLNTQVSHDDDIFELMVVRCAVMRCKKRKSHHQER